MAFPEDVLNIKVEIAPDGDWIDITDYVYKDKIQIYRGADDETSDSSPTRCRLRLNNIDGRFSPRNPNGPYYGKLGLNTPLLVSVMDGEHYLDVPGTGRARTVANFTCPDSIDIRYDALIYNWHQEEGLLEFASCYDIGTGTGFILQLDNGRPSIFWGGASGGSRYTPLTAITVPASGRLTLRCVLDFTEGICQFYQGTSVEGPWIKVGPVLDLTTNPMVGPDNVPLTVGGGFTGVDFSDANGKVYRMQLRDGHNGPVIADTDFSQVTVGDTAFTDLAGVDFSVTDGAHVNNQYNRFRGEVSSWPTRWVTGGFDAWEDVQAYSILRRYGQGVEELRSTMARTIPLDPNVIAYWPMEDPDNGQRALSALTPNTRTLSIDGDVSLAAHAGPPGSDALPTFNTDSSWHGETPTERFPAGSNDWQVQWLTNFQQFTTSEQMFCRIKTTGTIWEWRLFIDQDTVRVVGYAFDDEGKMFEVFNNAYTWDFGTNNVPLANAVNHWIKWQLSAKQVGLDIEWTIAALDIDIWAGSLATETVAGFLGPVHSVMGPPRGLHADITGMAMGQIAVYAGDEQSIFDEADRGFLGEDGLTRMRRLTQEVGENFVFLGDYRDTQTMGEQRPDRLLDLVREVADTDRGIFGDTRDVAQWSGFRFVGRSALYNQTPVLFLDYEADGEVHEPLDPTDDDQYLRNRVTAQQERGSSAVAEKAEGKNSTEAPPFGVGPYPTTVSVNTDTAAVLPDIAGWEVHLGTWDEERYPTVLLKLHAAPHLIQDALKIDQGTVICIRNARDADTRTWVPPGDIFLMVRGYNETMAQFEWELELQCVPARPYNVPVLTGDISDASPQGHDHVDTDYSETASAILATDPVLPLFTYAGPSWTDEVADYPFALTVGGEEVRAVAPGGIINGNPFFDTGVAGWSAVDCTAAQSEAVLHPDPEAVASAELTPDGVSVLYQFVSDGIPAVAGATYRTSFWCWSPSGEPDVRVGALYQDSVGGSTGVLTGPTTVIPAGEWTYLEYDSVAPAGTTVGRMQVQARDTPTEPLYVWAARLTRTTADWANDTFTRTVVDDWGEMDSGDDWLKTGGLATDYSVGSGYGQHLVTSLDVSRRSYIDLPGDDFDLYADIAVSELATGGGLFGGIMARHVDVSNLYHARVEFTTGGSTVLSIRKRLAGTESDLGSVARELPYTADEFFTVRFRGVGGTLKMKMWKTGLAEPPAWHLQVTDLDLTTGAVGLRSIVFAGNTNASPAIRYDNFRVASPQVLAVERSRNRVVKAHDAGDDVRLTNPAITAL